MQVTHRTYLRKCVWFTNYTLNIHHGNFRNVIIAKCSCTRLILCCNDNNVDKMGHFKYLLHSHSLSLFLPHLILFIPVHVSALIKSVCSILCAYIHLYVWCVIYKNAAYSLRANTCTSFLMPLHKRVAAHFYKKKINIMNAM